MARKSRKALATAKSFPKIHTAAYNTGLYIRLSVVDSGKKDSESISNQQNMLEMYVFEHPELVLKGVFIDNGETGVDFIRPAWNNLMRECRDGNINCILIKDGNRFLSRQGKKVKEGIKLRMQGIKKQGIK